MLIQILLVTLMSVAFFVTWKRVHQRIIHVREALGWSVVWVVASIAILRPEMTTQIAHLFGVGRGVDFVVYGSVAVLFLLIFRLFLQHEKIERTMTLLVRESALQNLKRTFDDQGSKDSEEKNRNTI